VVDLCPFCNNKIEPYDKFCSKCGNEIPKSTVPLSTFQKIKIYTLCVLLAPFGIYWFFKYFKNEDPEKKKVAYISLFITILMLIVLVVVNLYFVKALEQYVGSYESSIYGL